MPFYCYLCELEYAGFFAHFCTKCRRLKHLISVYGDRVYEVVDEVLVRQPQQQNNKIKIELKKEIEKKEYALRSKNKEKKKELTETSNEILSDGRPRASP